MGRDLIVLNIPERIETVSQLGDGPLEPLGSRDRVLDMISAVFPDIDTSDPKWIIATRQEYSLSFSIGGEEPVEVLLITIHGSQAALDEVKRLCELNGWRAFDSAEGEFIDFS